MRQSIDAVRRACRSAARWAFTAGLAWCWFGLVLFCVPGVSHAGAWDRGTGAAGGDALMLGVSDASSGSDVGAHNSARRRGKPKALRCLGRAATIVVKGRSAKGTSRADVITVGNRKGARVKGGGGADRICGGPGRDVLIGGRGNDKLAGAGRDRLVGGKGVDEFKTKGRRVLADATAGEVVNGRRRTLDAKLRQSSVKVPGSRVGSVRRRGAVTEVVLGRGVEAPRAGGVLVVPISKRAPEGVVGKVVGSRRLNRGATLVRTRPAALDEAYRRFRLAYTGTLADFGDPAPSGAGARSAQSKPIVKFTCNGAGSATRSVEVDLGAFSVQTVLDTDPQFPYFSLNVVGRPRFTLRLDARGAIACSAAVKKQCRPFGPVILCFTPILKLDADGRVTLRYDWNPRFTYNLVRAAYTPSRNRDDRTFESHGNLALDGEANAHARLHLGVTATVGGAVGLVGSLAPHIDGRATFRTPPPTACVKLTAAIDYQLSAYANVFVKKWDWDIAKGQFLNRTLLDRCTNTGGGGGGGGTNPGGGPGGLGPPSRSLSAGARHTCGLRGDSTAVCWGDDSGAGPPPAGIFGRIASGPNGANCALSGNGAPTCWPVGLEPPTETFTDIAVGTLHACGLSVDGAATCWGSNSAGELDVPPGEFTELSAGGPFSAGGGHTCGVRTGGAVSCWGRNDHGQAAPPAGAFAHVSAGGSHSCGVTTGGSVACWGYDGAGQLNAPAGAFKRVSAGGGHSCGLRTDGTVVCWGNDNVGQASAPGGSFVAVAAGGVHTCGLRVDRSVSCWGSDAQGQSTPPPEGLR